jgi:hypothetical protein
MSHDVYVRWVKAVASWGMRAGSFSVSSTESSPTARCLRRHHRAWMAWIPLRGLMTPSTPSSPRQVKNKIPKKDAVLGMSVRCVPLKSQKQQQAQAGLFLDAFTWILSQQSLTRCAKARIATYSILNSLYQVCNRHMCVCVCLCV